MSTNRCFALVDCNNFYASCERVFNPALNNKPVVILSNNDGCIIARSNEAKAVGIPMGAPYFKYKQLMLDNDVKVFSSNYQLYGDMSHRVMKSLDMLCPDIEIYSIDEAFLRLDGFDKLGIVEYASSIRDSVFQWTGIPTSIGIAPTKTLSKIANRYAKKSGLNVFDLRDPGLQDAILDQTPVEDIWGISNKLGMRLRALGIGSAKQLRDANIKMIRKNFSVVQERMVLELRGFSCLDMEDVQPKKSIMSSRSFGKHVSSLEELDQAISSYAARACIKLRNQHSRASGIYVFAHTNYFKKDLPQYSNSITSHFTLPTSDTGLIIIEARKCMAKLYRKGFQYKKVGIMLCDLVPSARNQQNLLDQSDHVKSDKLMNAMDEINSKMGINKAFHASQGVSKTWQIKSDLCSPRYTTVWDEFRRVN